MRYLQVYSAVCSFWLEKENLVSSCKKWLVPARAFRGIVDGLLFNLCKFFNVRQVHQITIIVQPQGNLQGDKRFRTALSKMKYHIKDPDSEVEALGHI